MSMMAAGEAPITHTFEVESTDHCETPITAYQEIAPLLEKLAALLGKTKETLCIYDPYFCAGGVKRHLGSLGFPKVYNENEDFYKTISSGRIPYYDVLLTNPPYSTTPFDHIERLMQFCKSQRKPYFILQPCYVYIKDYYKDAMVTLPNEPPVNDFYFTPSGRYTYRTPTGLRDVKAGALSTSPFVTFWFCAAWSHRDALVKWWCERGKLLCPGSTLKLSAVKIPRKFKDSNDPTRPRLRKKQREALKRRTNKALGLDPFRRTKKSKGARKFNRGDTPHRKKNK